MRPESKHFPRQLSSRRRRGHRSGIAFAYVAVMMVTLTGLTSMAVDLGRVQVAQSQLQAAVDAAARYGAVGIKNVLYGVSAAPANAAVAAADWKVDGVTLALDQTNDVQLGVWDTTANTFTADNDPSVANAVRVTGKRWASRGTAIPLLFLKVLGQPSFDISAQATAVIVPGASITPTVPATSNPFLSAQPAGVSASNGNPHNSPDWSYGTPGKPNSSPVDASAVGILPGKAMTFDGINGTATNDVHNQTQVSADGDTGSIVSNTAGAEHGISNIVAPINSLVAVFVGPVAPGALAPPATLNFSSATSRDFTSLSPLVNQLFFVGDGRNSSGGVQNFVVPVGATRLFIGTMDSYEWNNNAGYFTMTIHAPSTVKLVH